MRLLHRFGIALSLVLVPASAGAQVGGGAASKVSARASLSIRAEVAVAGQRHAAAGDKAYAAGDAEAALVAYGQGFATTRDAAFVYAMARCHQAAGRAAEARALFELYLSASGAASARYRGEAETAVGAGASTGVGLAKGAVKGVRDTVGKVGAGVWTAAKVAIAAQVNARARAQAKAADAAYAAGTYEEAARGYLEAYASSQQSVALYAAAQARAQAGDATSARALLSGYLAAQPKGAQAGDARSLLLALGGNPQAVVVVSIKATIAAAAPGDAAFKAGKYHDAAKAYAEAMKTAPDPALLYAQGMAELYAGKTAEAAASLRAYLAAGASAAFKAQAEASLRLATTGTVRS